MQVLILQQSHIKMQSSEAIITEPVSGGSCNFKYTWVPLEQPGLASTSGSTTAGENLTYIHSLRSTMLMRIIN